MSDANYNVTTSLGLHGTATGVSGNATNLVLTQGTPVVAPTLPINGGRYILTNVEIDDSAGVTESGIILHQEGDLTTVEGFVKLATNGLDLESTYLLIGTTTAHPVAITAANGDPPSGTAPSVTIAAGAGDADPDTNGGALFLYAGNAGIGAGAGVGGVVHIEAGLAADGTTRADIELVGGRITSTGPVQLPSYTVAGVPSASTMGAGSMIYVSNEAGGAVPAFSDATNWRRVTDRVIIS